MVSFAAVPLCGPPDSRRAYERTLSLVEVAVLVCLQFAVVWLGLWLLALPRFMPIARVLFGAEFVYLAYVSPVWLHRDRLADRGLGTWRTLFVRTDNLAAAARGFGWLALGGTVVLVLAAAIWNPGWSSRLTWQAVLVRARVYSISVVVQALIVVGFGLPRLKSILLSDRPLLIAVAMALLFGGLHMPYWPLVALAATFGFTLAWLSLRTPNVLAAACCHLVLGLQIHFLLGLSMRVGIFHQHPDVRFLQDIFSFAGRATGQLR